MSGSLHSSLCWVTLKSSEHQWAVWIWREQKISKVSISHDSLISLDSLFLTNTAFLCSSETPTITQQEDRKNVPTAKHPSFTCPSLYTLVYTTNQKFGHILCRICFFWSLRPWSKCLHTSNYLGKHHHHHNHHLIIIFNQLSRPGCMEEAEI